MWGERERGGRCVYRHVRGACVDVRGEGAASISRPSQGKGSG